MARQRQGDRLDPLLNFAFYAAVEFYAGRIKNIELVHQRAARIVIGALTILVLRDKESLDAGSPSELIEEAKLRFDRNFAGIGDLRSIDRRLLVALLHELGDWTNYNSLDVYLPSSTYEKALVADEQRARLGIHYTPPDLANRLLAELPVEFLPPEDRYVLDPACGSGTLLVAAHNRLSSLQPPSWSNSMRHEDLRVHLRGIDIDPIATEIARLALLLNAMPAGNGWHVDTRDSLELDPDAVVPRPSIVVANPPWRHRRSGGVASELADRFVARSMEILRPGGLLALLLPQSWMESEASRGARDHLRSNSDLFEIWRLPVDTFPTSNARARLCRHRTKALWTGNL